MEPVTSTALTQTTRELLADQNRAVLTLTAKFPRDLSDPAAAMQLVSVAVTYGLDPFMGDIVPFQGRPFVTEQGWLRLIGRHAPSQLVRLESRPANKEEREEISLPTNDFLGIAQVTRKYPTGDELTVKRRGRVTHAEATGATIDANKRGYTPVEKEPYEMAETRARRRALRTAFRDVLTAQGMPVVIEETGEIIEGESRVIEERPTGFSDAPKQPLSGPEDNLKDAADRARSELYAEASKRKILSKGQLHSILGFGCKGLPPQGHTELSGPDECHALRDAVNSAMDQGRTAAEAWEMMRETMISNCEPRPPEPEPVTAGEVEVPAEAEMPEAGPEPAEAE